MKLQFSLATLLVCMTVLAVVCAIAISMPVRETTKIEFTTQRTTPEGKPVIELSERISESHSPTAENIAWRVGLWGTSAVAATLGVLWAIRRLKSRRENWPPVG
jgi:hypothetical protein